MDTLNFENQRCEARIEVSMRMRAAVLPGHQAEVLDLSNHGARIRVKGLVGSELEESTIRFGAGPKEIYRPTFEGLARIAWVQTQENGQAEIGLQWEKMTPSAWNSLKRSLQVAS